MVFYNFLFSKVRGIQDQIDEFLFDLGSSAIMQESENPSDEAVETGQDDH